MTTLPALPVPPPRRGSYLWLGKIGGAPEFHGTAAELAELEWSIREWPTMESTLSLLAQGAPLDPDACDPSMARALRCLVLKGHAEPTEDGRIRITLLGEMDYAADRPGELRLRALPAGWRLQMRILVCGGRDYADREKLAAFLADLRRTRGITHLIAGGARGADTMAAEWATARSIPCLAYMADWDGLGPKAGPIRNQRMLDEGKPDLVVAFPGGRGTADMVRRAREAGVETIEVRD